VAYDFAFPGLAMLLRLELRLADGNAGPRGVGGSSKPASCCETKRQIGISKAAQMKNHDR